MLDRERLEQAFRQLEAGRGKGISKLATSACVSWLCCLYTAGAEAPKQQVFRLLRFEKLMTFIAHRQPQSLANFGPIYTILFV